VGDSLVARRIGLLGGTFNPIHFGHLNLAIEMQEKCTLDEVWMIPARLSPFKLEEPLISGEDRLEMVRLAIEGLPSFRVLDVELSRPPPSYTIDTLHLLDTSADNFFLLLGEDAFAHFDKWKNHKEILQKVSLRVAKRKCSTQQVPLAERVDTREMEISSTEVRERIKKRLYCGHLIPYKVLDYIYEHQLYFTV